MRAKRPSVRRTPVYTFGPVIKLQFWSNLKLFEGAFLVRTRCTTGPKVHLLDPMVP